MIMSLSKLLSSTRKITQQLDSSRQAIIRKIKQNPNYRFQSVEEIAIASELGIKIDVNLATVDDWLRLPNISINQARNLVEITNSGVYFLCLEDLASALGVSVLKIQFWQPILYFAYYDSDSFHAPAKINPNMATLKELVTIPNVDATIAQKIINNREEKGKYRNLADLKQRLDLTADFTYHIMYYLKF